PPRRSPRRPAVPRPTRARWRWRSRTGSLHRRAERPRRELVVAVAELLALRLPARRGVEDQPEEALARLGNRLGAVDDRAAVEVHVVFLVREERRVGGELERWRRLAAVGRAAPGGEADHVGAAGDLAGRGYGVVARRIHIDKAFCFH